MTLIAVWLALAVIAAIVEILSPLFGFIFMSGAAVVAALGAGVGLPLWLQLVLFSVSLLGSLAFLRPRLVDRLGAPGVPSRSERLMGQRGQVTEAIDPDRGTGRVLVAGQDWAARSLEPVPAGAEIVVDGADGIVLSVAPAD